LKEAITGKLNALQKEQWKEKEKNRQKRTGKKLKPKKKNPTVRKR
jgi:hypothetical protein